MNKTEKQEYIRNSVRIQSNNRGTIGSGMLYVPKDGMYAYVLTAAHVVNQEKDSIQIQCYSDDKDDGKYTCSVDETMIYIHESYTKQKDKTEVQYCDAAIVKILKRGWMQDRAFVYYGIPQENLPVFGCGYSGANREEDIRQDYISIETTLRDVLKDNHRMRIRMEGDFSLNHADRAEELRGISGTILFAQGQQKTVAVGMICSTGVNNAPFGMVNVIDMTGCCEILKKLGVDFEFYDVELKKNEDKKWMHLRISTNRYFVGRDVELNVIQKDLQRDKLVILSGIGGIGKTELARYYAKQHQAEYTCAYEVPCTVSILDGIAEHVEINGLNRKKTINGLESNEQYGQRKLDWILAQPSSVLFIFDDASPEDPAWPRIVTINQDKIVTSRWSKENWKYQVEEIIALEGIRKQQCLFEQYLERNLEKEEMPIFQDIVNLVNGHTLTLQLIALQCNASDTTLEEILESLKLQGLCIEDENLFRYKSTEKERNMYGHIRTIWKLAALNEEEEKVMQGLCLLPEQGITRKEYQTLMHLSNLNAINHLKRQGWIQSYQIKGKTWIYLHMVISEIIYWELYQKKTADIEELQRGVLHELQDRNKEFLERLRYISYGKYMGTRLICSLKAVQFLNGLSMELENLRELTDAINVLNKAESYLKELNALNTLDAADCYNNIAVVYQTGKNFQLAYEYFEKASVVYRSHLKEFPEKYGLVLHNMARVNISWGKYQKAMALETKAEELIKNGRKKRLGNVYDGMAVCYEHEMYCAYETWRKDPTNKKLEEKIRYNMERKWEYWDKAVKTKEKYCPDLQSEIMLSKANRACSDALLGNYEEAQKDIQTVFEFYQRTTKEDSIELGDVYDKMCLIYEKSQEYHQACRYGEYAVHIFEKYGKEYAIDLKRAEDNLLLARAGLQKQIESDCVS